MDKAEDTNLLLTMRIIIFLSTLIFYANCVVVDDDKSLSFVYALWRHGDRSPSKTFVTDPIKENQWLFGEGGFGVLTPIGMEQQFNLGRLLRQRYLHTGFLSNQYTAKEVKIFASKIVRTQLSAISNTLGMYGTMNDNLKGISYPEVNGWPIGYIPIPNIILEEASNALMNCPRSQQIEEMIKRSKKYEQLKYNPKTIWLLSELTRLTSVNATLDNLEEFYEALKTESIHFPDILFSWCSKEVFDGVMETFSIIDDLRAGIDVDGLVEGIDLSYEVPLLHGGYFTEMMKDQMNKDNNNGLKYMGISAHDIEVTALLNIFGIKQLLYKGRPEYASIVLFEQWIDSNGNKFIKVLFRYGPNGELKVVTSLIDGCDNDYCPYEIIHMFFIRYHPGNITELCSKSLKTVKPMVRGNRLIIDSKTGKEDHARSVECISLQ